MFPLGSGLIFFPLPCEHLFVFPFIICVCVSLGRCTLRRILGVEPSVDSRPCTRHQSAMAVALAGGPSTGEGTPHPFSGLLADSPVLA